MMIIYLFISTRVNNCIREIKWKNSMHFCWEDCEASRRNSIRILTASFLFPCIFLHLRKPGFVCCVLQDGFHPVFRFLYKHQLFEVDPANLQSLFSSAFEILKIQIFIHYSPLPLFHCEQEERGSTLADWLHSMNSKETVFQQSKI